MKKSNSSMKADYQKYLQSVHWQERRKLFIADTGHMCEKCDMPRWLAQIAYQQDLNVHHLNYQNLGHEEDCDLEALCRRCHEIETFSRSDFRAPKKAECSLCAESHWDVYGDFCEVCLALLSIKEPISLRFDYTSPCDNHAPIWKLVVRELVWYFENSPRRIDDAFSEISETIKRIRKAKHPTADGDIPF